jgi:hypothetical protein
MNMSNGESRLEKVQVLRVNPLDRNPTNETVEMDNFDLLYETPDLTKTGAPFPAQVLEIREKTKNLEGTVYSLKEFKEVMEKYECMVMASDFFDPFTHFRGLVGVCLDKNGKPTLDLKKASQKYLIGQIKYVA